MTRSADGQDPRYGQVDREYAARLATAADDGPVWMVNLMKYRERADYANGDGIVGNSGDISGREADSGSTPDDMAAYQQAAGRVAQPHGARVHGWFTAGGTIVGDGRNWDQVRFNAFPSVAYDHGSPVSTRYTAPFRFESTLHEVKTQLLTRQDVEAREADAAAEMSRQ